MIDIFETIFMDQRDVEIKRLMKMNLDLHRRSAKSLKSTEDLEERLERLEADLGFSSLLLYSLMKKLVEKGVVTLSDVTATMKSLDGLDGKIDNQLNMDVLRGNLEMLPSDCDADFEEMKKPVRPKKKITMLEKLEREKAANEKALKAHKLELQKKLNSIQRKKRVKINTTRKVGGTKETSTPVVPKRQTRKSYRK